MSSISIISVIGLGNYARAIGTQAAKAGHAVEVIGRDAAKTKDLAAELGGGATAGTFGTTPAGDIVILAVPYASAVAVIGQYGDANRLRPRPGPGPPAGRAPCRRRRAGQEERVGVHRDPRAAPARCRQSAWRWRTGSKGRAC
jgi:hypothetical protein